MSTDLHNARSMTDLTLVTAHNGVPMADSRVIAEVFGKEHKNVLRDIREMQARDPEWSAAQIRAEYVFNALRQTQIPYYLLTRDAATMLIMGFTGAEAFVWKRRYVEAFNAMEAQLKATPAPAALTDEAVIHRALQLTHDRMVAAEAKVAVLEPALAREVRVADITRAIVTDPTWYNISAALKQLNIPERAGFKFMLATKWLYHENKGEKQHERNQAHNRKVRAGYLSHKEVPCKSSPTGWRNQAQINKKGMEILGEAWRKHQSAGKV